MATLRSILGPGLAAAIEEVLEPECWPTPDELDDILERWSAAGAQLIELGQSSAGRPIRCAVIGLGQAPTKTMLAWGYPHPDEPIGAAALVALGEAALAGKLGELAYWRMALVLCADPDQASRQLWLHGDGSAREFARGCWRPIHLGLEVDYGFPIDWGPFYQPPDYEGKCHTSEECARRCGGPPCRYAERPFRPLPESMALERALMMLRPELVFSMHCTHTGGDYTFLLAREDDDVLDDLVAIPAACGTVRHLGEPIDRGRRWRRHDPDLIRERTLENRRRALERHPAYKPGYAYAGNAAAVSVIEANLPGTQFVCPEATHFRHPDFGDTSLTDEQVTLRIAIEKRPRGTYQTTRFEDNGEWAIASQKTVSTAELRGRSASGREHEITTTAPRSVLGVRALLRRRRALATADRIWERVAKLPGLAYHPYRDERARLTVPGAYVNDGSMLVFRTRPDYRRAATRAQAADFNWRWPLHTASLLGNMANFLRHQDPGEPEISRALRELDALIDAELVTVPPQLRDEAPKAPAMRSQLARVLRLMQARSR